MFARNISGQMITSFNSKTYSYWKSERGKRQCETKPQGNTTGFSLSLLSWTSHFGQVSCWIMQSRPALAPFEHWTLETSPFPWGNTHSRFHPQPRKSLPLSSLGTHPCTKRMKANLLHQGKCHPHLPGAAEWPEHSGCCQKHPWAGDRNTSPSLAVMPSTLWIQHPQPYHTRLKTRVLPQHPRLQVGALFAPHYILGKSSGISHTCTWDYHTSPQFLWLSMNFVLSWFLSGEVEERESESFYSKDVEEPSEKGKHHCCVQEIRKTYTNSSGLRYPQPSRCTHNFIFLCASGKALLQQIPQHPPL